MLANSWYVFCQFDKPTAKQRNGWRWIVSLGRGSYLLVGTRYYTTERAAKRSANKVLTELFGRLNEMP